MVHIYHCCIKPCLVPPQELSLAGNNLARLPPDIGRLTALRRLQLSGNLFESLPEEIGQLTKLQACFSALDLCLAWCGCSQFGP